MGSTFYTRVSIHEDRSTDMVFKCSPYDRQSNFGEILYGTRKNGNTLRYTDIFMPLTSGVEILRRRSFLTRPCDAACHGN
jgi:hypothetical protein